MNRRSLLGMTFLVVLVLLLASCGSKVEGTYSNANGSVMLELKSGGDANLTLMGETMPCTYKVDGSQVSVDCKGDTTVFTIHDDGSLTGPPGSLIGALRKQK
jgi:hypothetical protein